MNVKIDSIRYILMSTMLLCCVVAAKAQGESTSSNIIASSSYKEVNGNFRFVGEGGSMHVLPRNNIDARVVVDKSKSQIIIDLVGQGVTTQSIGQDAVIINIEGVTILTKSANENAPKVETVYAATTPTKTTSTASTEPAKKNASAKSPAKESTSRLVDVAAFVKGGFLFYDNTATIFGANLRSTVRLNSKFRIGLSVLADIYSIFPGEDQNNDVYSMSMLGTALACDFTMWDRDKPSIVPARLTVDVGAGFGIGSTEASGLLFSPGMMWYVTGAEGTGKLCVTVNYRYQQLSSKYYASGMVFGLGYRF